MSEALCIYRFPIESTINNLSHEVPPDKFAPAELTFAGCARPESAVAGPAVTGGDARLGPTPLVVLPLTRAVVTDNTRVDPANAHVSTYQTRKLR